jgi:PKD repeat protein
VANREASQIWQYDVGAGGVLLSKSTATVSQIGPEAMAVSPDGRSLYVTSQGGSMSQYDVGAGGALTPKTPSTVGAGAALTNPDGVVLSPDGSSLYIANCGNPACAGGSVFQYDVGARGLLSPQAPSAVAAGQAPSALTVLPDQGPTAAFTASPASVGSRSSFDASASSDPDGTIARYDWSFGDGSSSLNAGPTPVHVYGRAGTYAVQLTVTDNSGCSTVFVYTGQTASCNGGPAASIVHMVTVAAAPGPTLTRVSESHRRWTSARRKGGTMFSFVLNEPATVSLRFTRKHSRAAPTLSVVGHTGANQVRFDGRVGRTKLGPGSYSVTITATNTVGLRSSSHTLRFTILR